MSFRKDLERANGVMVWDGKTLVDLSFHTHDRPSKITATFINPEAAGKGIYVQAKNPRDDHGLASGSTIFMSVEQAKTMRDGLTKALREAGK